MSVIDESIDTDLLEDRDYQIKTMSEEQIIKMSRHFWDTWVGAFGPNISKARSMRDFVFVKGAQWEDENNGLFNAARSPGNSGLTFSNCSSVRELRRERGKSTYEINMIKPIYRQMYAEQLMASPQAELVPTNNNREDAPTKMLDVVSNRYRYDCYESNTKQIYYKTYQSSTACGYGAYYLSTIKENPMNFNEELRFFPILDSSYAFFDPRAKTATKQDGNWAGLWQVASYREVKCAYPKADIKEDRGEAVNDLKVEKDDIAFCNIYVREPETISIVKLETGEILLNKDYNKQKKRMERVNERLKAQASKDRKRAKEEGLPKSMWPTFTPMEMPKVVRRQKSESSKIYHIMHTKSKILKKILLPVKKYLPQIFVCGDSFWAGGQEFTMPLCEDAVTSQKLANYVFSEIIDNIDKSFGTVILAHTQAIGNRLQEYRRPTISNVLEYGTIGGQNTNPQNVAASRPSLLSSTPIDPSLLAVYNQTIKDIYNTLGRSLENHGGQTNAQSGVAIGQRTNNGNTSVGVYPENLNEGIVGGTKAWLEWAPHVYDTERDLMVQDENKKFTSVKINYNDGELEQDDGKSDEKRAEDKEENMKRKNHFFYELSQFTIECQGGLSFAAQRDKAIEAMVKLMAINPQALPPLMLDLLVAILPFPFANQIKMRLRESGFIDPQVLAIEKGEKPPAKEPSDEEKLMESKLKEQILGLISSIEKNKADRLNEVFDLEKALADSVSSIAGDYSETPLPEIGDALTVTADMLKSVTQSITQNMS